jgi:hypothetical protein
MSATALLGDFKSELAQLEVTHDKAVALQSAGHLQIADLDYLVEALALHLSASFESFLNDLFLDLMTGSSGLQGVGTYVTPMAAHLVREILYGDSDIMSWLPLKTLQNRATRFLPFGQPFTRLAFRKLDLIEDLRIVRNRIAHHGQRARQQYENRIVRGDLSLTRPARWLTHEPLPAGGDNLVRIIRLIDAISVVVSTDSPAVDSLLGPANLIAPDQPVPAGSYRCATCNTQRSSASDEKLGQCTTCAAIARTKPGLWALNQLNAPP